MKKRAKRKNSSDHQLLTRTSGFGQTFGGDHVAINRDVFLSLAWATRLDFEPGTRYHYSNAGYSIAAAIAEITSGQSYESALEKYILAPAQLNRTGYRLPDWTKQTLAVGYSGSYRREPKNAWADDGSNWNLRDNEGLLTTATDLLKWHDVVSGESVLSASSIQALQGRHVDTTFGSDNTGSARVRFYGYGWSTQDEPPRRSVSLIHGQQRILCFFFWSSY